MLHYIILCCTANYVIYYTVLYISYYIMLCYIMQEGKILWYIIYYHMVRLNFIYFVCKFHKTLPSWAGLNLMSTRPIQFLIKPKFLNSARPVEPEPFTQTYQSLISRPGLGATHGMTTLFLLTLIIIAPFELAPWSVPLK